MVKVEGEPSHPQYLALSVYGQGAVHYAEEG